MICQIPGRAADPAREGRGFTDLLLFLLVRRKEPEKPVEQFRRLRSIFHLHNVDERELVTRGDGLDSDALIAQSYGERDELSLLEEFQRHFSDSRYIRINGRPLLIISRPALIPNTVDTLRRWKEYWRTAHGDAPLLVGVHGFGMDDPREFGLDAALEFPLWAEDSRRSMPS
jgi:hypothetical protein